MKNYDTGSEETNAVIQRCYTMDFTPVAAKDCPICNRCSIKLSSNEFQMDEIHRFEGNADPGDEMIVFPMSSPKRHVERIVVNAYGIYAEKIPASVVEDLYLHCN